MSHYWSGHSKQDTIPSRILAVVCCSYTETRGLESLQHIRLSVCCVFYVLCKFVCCVYVMHLCMRPSIRSVCVYVFVYACAVCLCIVYGLHVICVCVFWLHD